MTSAKTCAKTLLSFKEDRAVESGAYVERRRHPRYWVKLPLDFWQTPNVVQAGVVTDMNELGLGFNSIHM
jgi:hypothetical protein